MSPELYLDPNVTGGTFASCGCPACGTPHDCSCRYDTSSGAESGLWVYGPIAPARRPRLTWVERIARPFWRLTAFLFGWGIDHG